MTTANLEIDCRTSVLRTQGQLVVCCEIDHLIPSGLSVPEVFATLRPQLVAAIKNAAARDPLAYSARSPSVHMDVGCSDPGIALWVHSPAAAMMDLEKCLCSLEAITSRFVAGAALCRHRSNLGNQAQDTIAGIAGNATEGESA